MGSPYCRVWVYWYHENHAGYPRRIVAASQASCQAYRQAAACIGRGRLATRSGPSPGGLAIYQLPDRSVGDSAGSQPLENWSWQDLRTRSTGSSSARDRRGYNVLVYAHRREAKEHALAAHRLFELASSAERWAIPWPCVYEFLRRGHEPTNLEGQRQHRATRPGCSSRPGARPRR